MGSQHFHVKPRLERRRRCPVLQIVTTSVSGCWSRAQALITVVFVEKAGILLRSGAQHACPSSSRRFCCARLMILFHASALAGSVLNAFLPGSVGKFPYSFSLWPGSHQLKYFFSVTDPPGLWDPSFQTSHIRLARRHAGTSGDGRSQAICLPGCRPDALSPSCPC